MVIYNIGNAYMAKHRASGTTGLGSTAWQAIIACMWNMRDEKIINIKL